MNFEVEVAIDSHGSEGMEVGVRAQLMLSTMSQDYNEDIHEELTNNTDVVNNGELEPKGSRVDLMDSCDSNQSIQSSQDEQQSGIPSSDNLEGIISTSNISKDLVDNEKERFQCKEFRKSYKKKLTVKHHLLTHTDKRSAFHCEHCGKTFPTKWQVKQHMPVHTGERPHVCDQCGMAFTQKGSLCRHQMSKHQPECLKPAYQLYKEKQGGPRESSDLSCALCSASKCDHKSICHIGANGAFSCKHCGDSFTTQDRLDEHLVTPYACDQCDKLFRTSGYLAFHQTGHLLERELNCNQNNQPDPGGQDKLEINQECGQKAIQQALARRYKFFCHHCNQGFRSRYRFKIHERTHSSERLFACGQCTKCYTTVVLLTAHQQVHETKESEWLCDTCGKVFDGEKLLQSHQETHNIYKPFICEQCGKSFKAVYYLNRHKYVHLDKEEFQCYRCGESFKQDQDLKNHLAGHSPEKVFQCSLCTFKDPKKYRVLEHERVHTIERPFTCDKCGRAFATPRSLEKHESSHIKKERPKCRFCGILFNEAYQVIEHEQTHSQDEQSLPAWSYSDWLSKREATSSFICSKCGVTFKNRKQLQSHLQDAHSGQKEAIDRQLCGMAFQDTGSLKTCGFNETNIRYFPCKICSKVFQRHGSFRKHMKRHHNEEIPLGCSACARSFPNALALSAHRRQVHGPVILCEFCKQPASSNVALKNHVKAVHFGDAENVVKLDVDSTTGT